MGNLGRKKKEVYDMMSTKEDKNKIIYPTVRVSSNDISGLRQKDVGEEIKLIVKAKVKGIEIDKAKSEYNLELLSAEISNKVE